MKKLLAVLIALIPSLALADQPQSTFRCNPQSTFSKTCTCSLGDKCTCGPDCTCGESVGCGKKRRGGGGGGGGDDSQSMGAVYTVGFDQPANTYQIAPALVTTPVAPAAAPATATAENKCPVCGAKLTAEQIVKLKGETAAAPTTPQMMYYMQQPMVGSFQGGGSCAGGNCGTGRAGLFGRRR